MQLTNLLTKLMLGGKHLTEQKSNVVVAGIESFANNGGVPEGAKDRPGVEGLFWRNEGPIVHKWHHYLPIYDRYFAPYRDQSPRFLEIGVSKGGSLALWREYFGSDATIFGIDIDPSCAALNDQSAQVRIGSQDDPEFLARVVAEMGGIDIVLDDGSHFSRHIRASLDVLFPLLEIGGIYMIEDIHATYWSSHEGSYQGQESIIGDFRQMIDDLHHWYHAEGQKIAATSNYLSALHFHDSIAVLEKQNVMRPQHSQVGR